MSDLPIPIDYTSRDYAAIRDDLLAAAPLFIPEWTARSSTDFGVVLIDLFAMVGDVLNYYIDRAANEAYLSTAVRRQSVLALAALLDYRPSGASPAMTDVQFTTSVGSGSITIPKGTQVATKGSPTQPPIIFETDDDVTILGTLGAPTYVGTIPATQGETITGEAVGVSSGQIDQEFVLFNSPVIENSVVVFVDEGLGPRQWKLVTNLIDAAQYDASYSTFYDENGVLHVLFGDGVNGRIPTTGSQISADYRVGGGARGNVAAGSITQLVGVVAGVASVTNPAAASGGGDIESIESIRRNAPRSLSTILRAITLKDHEVLALKVPGVAKAAAEAIAGGVRIYIAPLGGGAPTAALTNDVLNYFADKKMAIPGFDITTAVPTYVTITVDVDINVLPQYGRETVRRDVQNAISALFDLAKVDFAYRVTLSSVYHAIQSVEGVDWGVVNALNNTGGVGLGDVVLNIDEIPVVTGVSVTVTATGGLIGS